MSSMGTPARDATARHSARVTGDGLIESATTTSPSRRLSSATAWATPRCRVLSRGLDVECQARCSVIERDGIVMPSSSMEPKSHGCRSGQHLPALYGLGEFRHNVQVLPPGAAVFHGQDTSEHPATLHLRDCDIARDANVFRLAHEPSGSDSTCGRRSSNTSALGLSLASPLDRRSI